MIFQYEVQDLSSAREFLNKAETPVELINVTGSTRYYGIYVIDQMFVALKHDFGSKIAKITVNVGDDYAALIVSKELGYDNIITS